MLFPIFEFRCGRTVAHNIYNFAGWVEGLLRSSLRALRYRKAPSQMATITFQGCYSSHVKQFWDEVYISEDGSSPCPATAVDTNFPKDMDSSLMNVEDQENNRIARTWVQRTKRHQYNVDPLNTVETSKRRPHLRQPDWKSTRQIFEPDYVISQI